MPGWVGAILSSRIVGVFARLLLTFPFWGSGLSKILDFGAAQAEMAHFNLNPPIPFAIAVATTQLIGSGLVIFSGRYAWLGAGMLGVFTLLTIPIAHAFWTMAEPQRTPEMYTAVEHLAVIGGLIIVSILRWRETGRR